MKRLIIIFFEIAIIFFIIETNAYETNDFDFYNKSIIYFGDSISAGSENNMVSWDKYINDEANFVKSINAAKGGATFSNVRVDNIIIDQIKKYKNKTFDYVLLQGGVNDAMDEAVIGKMTDSYDLEDFDQNTYIGMLDTTFYYLTNYFHGSAIGVVITYKTPNASEFGWGGHTSNPEEYYDALIKVCDKWDIPYINFYDGKLSNIITDKELDDGLHLNNDGYEKISPYLYDFIKEIQPYLRNLKREEEIKNSNLKYYNEKY